MPTKDELNEVYQLYKHGLSDLALQKASYLLEHAKPVSYLYNLSGIIHAKNGNHPESQYFFKKAIELDPNKADLHYNLGKALKESEKYAEALQSYQNAIALKPDHAMAYHNMGITQKELGQLSQSLQSYQKALKLNPKNPDFYNSIGNIFRLLDRFDEAVDSYNTSLQLAPQNYKTYYQLGTLFKSMGNIENAIKQYDLCLKFNPDYTEAVRELVLLKKVNKDTPQLAQLHQLQEESTNTLSEEILLNFALGKSYQDMQNTQKAFNYFQKANQLRKKELDYHFHQDEKLFEKIMHSFQYLGENDNPIEGSLPFAPVFIVGMPRSGTSLVEQILSSHSKVLGAGELTILHQLAMSVFDDPLFSQNSAAITKISLTIMKQYADQVTERFGQHAIITDKMPTNFLWLGFVLIACPQSKIIHLNRDPMAVCWSIFQRYFPAKGLGFAYDLEDLGHYYKRYTHLMNFWKERFPESIYDLHYETLTEHQEEETKKLLEYCGLEWEESCLKFYKTQRSVNTASSTQVREKMYTGSSNAWKKYEAYLEPLKKILYS